MTGPLPLCEFARLVLPRQAHPSGKMRGGNGRLFLLLAVWNPHPRHLPYLSTLAKINTTVLLLFIYNTRSRPDVLL